MTALEQRDSVMSLQEAMRALGVVHGTLRWYIAKFRLETFKYPLDMHKYLRRKDVERLKRFREEARQRLH